MPDHGILFFFQVCILTHVVAKTTVTTHFVKDIVQLV